MLLRRLYAHLSALVCVCVRVAIVVAVVVVVNIVATLLLGDAAAVVIAQVLVGCLGCFLAAAFAYSDNGVFLCVYVYVYMCV